MRKPVIKVAGAVIKDGDKYLCMQRCRSKYDYISEHWEFPGGKPEKGESDHEALVREIKEEMDWDVYVGRQLGQVKYAYPDFTVRINLYLCKGGEGEFKLLEHLDYRWLTAEELQDLNWTAADREFVETLIGKK